MWAEGVAREALREARRISEAVRRLDIPKESNLFIRDLARVSKLAQQTPIDLAQCTETMNYEYTSGVAKCQARQTIYA